MADKFPYEDIISIPRHISKTHPQASMADRAARFSPFAAISGYEEMVKEAARVTEERIEITEAEKAILNEQLNMIARFLSDEPEVTITHFVLDKKKSGGAYITTTGIVKRIDELKQLVLIKPSTKDNLKDSTKDNSKNSTKSDAKDSSKDSTKPNTPPVKKIKIPDIYLIQSLLFQPFDEEEQM